MDSIIILDYANTRVVVIPLDFKYADNEAQIQAWCDENETKLSQVNWMLWGGTIEVKR